MRDRAYSAWEDQILDRYNRGEISKDEAAEQILLLQERYDDARRRRNNIA